MYPNLIFICNTGRILSQGTDHIAIFLSLVSGFQGQNSTFQTIIWWRTNFFHQKHDSNVEYVSRETQNLQILL